jgi:uncharacterized protein YsxB (DUF464 family)|uniref:Ribosomal processing cysteine protease Prp n=1 Tax=Mesoaciditoga lauensis TaxID=1495039 RepID=A0A7V3RE85_9BACT
MTRCDFFLESGEYIGFKISGHVGLGVKGKDLVCASVSALSQSTLIGLNEVLKMDIDYKIEDGMIECHLKESNECAQKIVSTLHRTLDQLSKQYPKNVSVFGTEVKR